MGLGLGVRVYVGVRVWGLGLGVRVYVRVTCQGLGLGFGVRDWFYVRVRGCGEV